MCWFLHMRRWMLDFLCPTDATDRSIRHQPKKPPQVTALSGLVVGCGRVTLCPLLIEHISATIHIKQMLASSLETEMNKPNQNNSLAATANCATVRLARCKPGQHVLCRQSQRLRSSDKRLNLLAHLQSAFD